MKSLIVALASFCCVAAFGDTRYVVPGGTGDGSSWANGASLDSILPSVADGDIVLLRQGVHMALSASAISLTGVHLTMRGGYAVGDADDAPSGDKYSTIISADDGLDNVWVHFDPETRTESLALKDGQPIPVVAEGALNLPPDYEGDYDVYYPGEINDGGEIVRCKGTRANYLKFDPASGLAIENVTISGFGNNPTPAKGLVDGAFVSFSAATVNTKVPLSLQDVAIIGNASCSSIFSSSSINTNPTGDVRDCLMKFNRLDNTGVFYFETWDSAPTFTDCVFESLAGFGLLRGSPIAISTGGRPVFTVTGCQFRRLAHDNTTVAAGNTVASVALALNTGGGGRVFCENCTFENCFVRNTRSTPLITTYREFFVRGARFANNRSVITPIGSITVSSYVAGLIDYQSGFTASPCDYSTFVSNSVTVTSAVAPAAYAAPVVNQNGHVLYNSCFFVDNQASVELTADGAQSRTSRALLGVTLSANSALQIDVINSTFCGSTPGDDLVYAATKTAASVNTTSKTGAWYSLFWSNARDYAYSGISADFDVHNRFYAERCVVKNAALLTSNIEYVSCSADDPMIAYDPVNRVWRPTVGVSGVNGNPNSYFIVKINTNTGTYMFSEGRDVGINKSVLNSAANVVPLLSRNGTYPTTDPAQTSPVPDFLGDARSTGDVTAGPVQTSFPEGRILTAAVHPAASGYVTIGSQYAGQEGFAAVTAVSADPSYVFQKWVDEDGKTLSDSATYTPTSEADYTRIRAVFGAPQVKWTFRVDPEKGAFANGETEIEMTLSPGDDAPGYPEIAANPAWHQTGWDRAMPPKVGSTDMEFETTFIPYTKVVYYDSHAMGSNDGTSWENAFTKLVDAVKAAGGDNSYVGEVRVRQGRHLIPNNTHSTHFINVRVVGGWTGNGEERSNNRRLTVFTGDNKDDDIFVDQHGNTVGKVYENGKFIEFRPPTEEEGWWDLANVSDDYASLMLKYNLDISCTNSSVECCTFYGFCSGQARLLESCPGNEVTITNCDFIGLQNIYTADKGVICLYDSAKVLDCGFYGMSASAVKLWGPSKSTMFELRDLTCLYSTSEKNIAPGRSVTFVNLTEGSMQAEDIEVGYIRCGNYFPDGSAANSYGGSVVFEDSSSFPPEKPTGFKRLHVHDILSPLNDRSVPLLHLSYCTDASYLEDCRFENIVWGEQSKTGKPTANGEIILVEAKTITNCVFRNVSLAYTCDNPTLLLPAALVSAKEGIYATSFEKCRLSTEMNTWSFLVMSKGITGSAYRIDLGDGTRLVDCSVTNLGVSANTTLGSAALVGARAVNGNTSPYRSVGKVLVKDCSVYAPGMMNAFVIDDLGSGVVADGLTVVNSRVEGGTALAGVLRTCTSAATPNTDPATTLINTTIAENTVASEAPIVATAYFQYFRLDVGWSTFYNNVAAYEFYNGNINGDYKQSMTSSVATSDADGWTAFKAYRGERAACGIAFANSYVKGVDNTSPYFSGENAFTVEPKMTGVVRNRRQRRYGVYHTPQSPYARQAELAGVYSDEAPVDAAGVARPPEGPVLLGAMQTTYAAPGLMLLVK